MSSYRLRKGLHIILKGHEYVIDRRLPSGDLRIKNIATNECRPVKEDYIVDALFNGELELLSDGGNSVHRELKRSRVSVETLGLLDDDPKGRKLKEEAKRRYKYVSGVINAGLTKFTRADLQPIIEQIAKKLDDPKSPSVSSVLGWFNYT